MRAMSADAPGARTTRRFASLRARAWRQSGHAGSIAGSSGSVAFGFGAAIVEPGIGAAFDEARSAVEPTNQLLR